MDNENDILLTIYVPTFNHENYIVKALDSILMQETEYKFEVLVGEDCSTDSTREVLKAYEAEHPGKLTVFYREKNMYKSSPNNSHDLKLRAKGKYLIALEGDDFWTDEFKLQKQIDFLEKHPEYYAVSHKCTVVGEDGLPNGEEYPSCQDAEYSFKHFFSEIMPGQLATVMYRNYMTDENFDRSLLDKDLCPGDRLMYFSLLCHGKTYCMNETMSAYRHITTHGSSFSANFSFNYSTRKPWLLSLRDYAKAHADKKIVALVEYQFLNAIIKAFAKRQITLKEAFSDYKIIKNKAKAISLLVKRIINKEILHKTLYL